MSFSFPLSQSCPVLFSHPLPHVVYFYSWLGAMLGSSEGLRLGPQHRLLKREHRVLTTSYPSNPASSCPGRLPGSLGMGAGLAAQRCHDTLQPSLAARGPILLTKMLLSGLAGEQSFCARPGHGLGMGHLACLPSEGGASGTVGPRTRCQSRSCLGPVPHGIAVPSCKEE